MNPISDKQNKETQNGCPGDTGLCVETIRHHLRTEVFGAFLHARKSISSTNVAMIEMANQGAPHGTVVLADEQTGGRGRGDRKWHSPPGVNLYLSILLRPEFAPDKAPPITLAWAVAAAEALELTTGLTPTLKWPNDLIVEKKKLCGILTEMHGVSKKTNWIVSGFGINVNIESFPPELKTIATSLRICTGISHSREKLAAALLERLENWYRVLLENGPAEILQAWKSRSNFLGQTVTIKTHRGPVEGLAVNLDLDGALLLQMKTGRVERILSGDLVLPV